MVVFSEKQKLGATWLGEVLLSDCLDARFETKVVSPKVQVTEGHFTSGRAFRSLPAPAPCSKLIFPR